MAHELAKRDEHNGVGPNPLVATLRYRCQCTGAEVLQISCVLDMDMREQDFIWTMRRLWRDVQFEVQQHIKNARPRAPAEQQQEA